jgi:hypothetical protein
MFRSSRIGHIVHTKSSDVKGGDGQHWYFVVFFENRKAPLKGAGNSRWVRIPVNFAGFALPLLIAEAFSRPYIHYPAFE